MEFRVAIIAGETFGDPQSEIAKRIEQRERLAQAATDSEEEGGADAMKVPWSEHLSNLEQRKQEQSSKRAGC